MQFLLGYDLCGNKYSVGELWRDCSYDFKKVFLQKTFHRFYMGDHSYMQLMKFEIT